MKKHIAFLAFIVGGILAVSNFAQSEDKLKIGIILPLTGPLAEYGIAANNGLELALNKNPALNNKFKFIIEDDQYNPKQSITAFNKLTDIDQVSLVYLWGSLPASAVAPVAENKHFPLVVMSINPQPLQSNKNWVINFSNSGKVFANVLIEELRKSNVKTIGIVKTEIPYLNSIYDELQNVLNNNEKITLIDSFSPSDNDLKSSYLKLYKNKFDALGVFLMSGQVAKYYRDIPNKLLPKITFGTDFFESKTEIEAAKGKMEGAIFPNASVEDWFYKIYEEKYKNDIQVNYAANLYDFVNLLENVTNLETKKENILNQLTSLEKQKGASGEFYFTEEEGYKSFRFPAVIRKIVSGKVVTKK